MRDFNAVKTIKGQENCTEKLFQSNSNVASFIMRFV